MSFNPYKAVLAVKSLNNVSNQKPYDPHAFKEELKTKFQATLALTNCFPNSMVFMEHLLSENVDEDGEAVPLTMQNYFEMDDIEKDWWEKEGDLLCEALIFLMNSKNDPMKKDLRLAYSHGNKKMWSIWSGFHGSSIPFPVQNSSEMNRY